MHITSASRYLANSFQKEDAACLLTMQIHYFLRKSILFALICQAFLSQAQIAEVGPSTVRKGYLFKSEWSIDAGIHTNGFFFGYNRGKIQSFHTTKTLHFDMGILYHPLETRTSRPGNVGLRSFDSYCYGKQNQMINFRVGRGIVKTLSEKARVKGIALGLRLEGGVMLGLEKPYFLKVIDEQDGRFVVREISYRDDPVTFLDQSRILGGSSFFKGFGHMGLNPGAFGRIGLRLDPGAFEKFVKSLEAGIQLDIYSRRPKIMLLENNSIYYVNFYINLQLGSRKTQSEL